MEFRPRKNVVDYRGVDVDTRMRVHHGKEIIGQPACIK